MIGASKGDPAGTRITWSAFVPIARSSSCASAITIPPRALACSTWLIIFSYNTPSRVATATTGIVSSIRAIGPCFISPAG